MTNAKQQIRKGAKARGRKAPQSDRVRESSVRGGSPSADRAPRTACGEAREKRGAGTSLCPVASLCGACQAIDVSYKKQLAAKDARMADLFADVAPAGALRPILGMAEPFHYRNKVTSPYAPARRPKGSKAGKDAKRERGHGRGRDGAASGKRRGDGEPLTARSIACGMYVAGTHRIIDSSGCLVENETAARIIQTIRQLMPKFHLTPYDEGSGEGFLRHAVVRVGHESGEILVTLVTNGEAFPGSRGFCRELVRRCPEVTTVVQNVNTRQTNVILGERERTLFGPGFILDTLCGLSFRISSQSFYQVNAVQTEVLYRTAVDLASFTGCETAVDAYCGTGTIGLVAARAGAAKVIGVDSVASAVRDARENARHNGVDNAEFVVGDAGKFMEELAAQRAEGAGEGPLVLLMDPPRAGASEEFLRAATALAPERIVYISCNPATQVRDIGVLRKAGYRVAVVQPVDMFPHTDHIESVALLVREERG